MKMFLTAVFAALLAGAAIVAVTLSLERKLAARQRADAFLKRVQEMHLEDRQAAVAKFTLTDPEAAECLRRCPPGSGIRIQI